MNDGNGRLKKNVGASHHGTDGNTPVNTSEHVVGVGIKVAKRIGKYVGIHFMRSSWSYLFLCRRFVLPFDIFIAKQSDGGAVNARVLGQNSFNQWWMTAIYKQGCLQLSEM